MSMAERHNVSFGTSIAGGCPTRTRARGASLVVTQPECECEEQKQAGEKVSREAHRHDERDARGGAWARSRKLFRPLFSTPSRSPQAPPLKLLLASSQRLAHRRHRPSASISIKHAAHRFCNVEIRI